MFYEGISLRYLYLGYVRKGEIFNLWWRGGANIAYINLDNEINRLCQTFSIFGGTRNYSGVGIFWNNLIFYQEYELIHYQLQFPVVKDYVIMLSTLWEPKPVSIYFEFAFIYTWWDNLLRIYYYEVRRQIFKLSFHNYYTYFIVTAWNVCFGLGIIPMLILRAHYL